MTDEKKPRKKKAPKAVGPGKLKKVTAKKPKGVHPYKVRFGSRNEFGEVRTYPTASKAKQAIIKELNSWKPWCIRFNNVGLDAIQVAITDADEMVFHEAHGRIECQFDEQYNLWLVAEFWTEP